MAKLWQTNKDGLNNLVEAYTVGDDYITDKELLTYDIKASLAHALMLNKMNILTDTELTQAQQGLSDLLILVTKNKFEISPSQEDGHTAIEQYLTNNFGEIGKKIHTGRSRNDQSLVMMRLFMKTKLDEIIAQTEELIKIYTVKSKKYTDVEMPGYTHMQRAMPTTVGVWLSSFGDALNDIIPLLNSAKNLIDQNPLGSASGFGIQNFPMERDVTTKQLGFAKTQTNPLYCGMSRGYFEVIVLQSIAPIMFVTAKFAQDMLLFTTQEFNFFKLPASFTTGSSIMPQKRNYDMFEIMRGNNRVFNAQLAQINTIVSTTTGGYQRDMQLTKKPFMQSLRLALDTINLLIAAVPELSCNKQALKKAMGPELFVTNEVYDLVNKGISFRDAYIEIKQKWNKNN